MDKPARRPGLPPEIGVLAVVAAASLPLGRIFRPGAQGELDFGTLQLVTLILSAFVAWGLRRLRVPVLVAAALSALGFVWLGSALFHAGAMFGPFPTPRSVDALFDSMRAGLKLVNTEVAPVAPTAGFLSLAGVGIWATMWLTDDAANRLRHPLLGIGLTLPVFAMPGTLLDGAHAWFEVALFCAAALLLLFQDERVRLSRWAGAAMRGWRPGLAARIGLVAIVPAVLMAPLLPGYGQPPGGAIRSGTGAGRITVNPLVSIKPTLDRFPAVTLFSVRAPVATYWRLTALDRFNGSVWTATPEAARVSLGRPIRRSSPSPASTRLEQEITVDSLGGPWLPGAFEPVSLKGIRGVFLQPASRTLVNTNRLVTGQRFTVVSEMPSPSSADLLNDDGPDPVGDRYLALPESLPAQIRQIALEVTASATTKLEKAIALQDYLRSFDYDLQVALHHSSFDLVRFLTTVRAGYCEQFAAAMGVLARSIGIPARLAIGFGGGEQIESDRYQVTSTHAHAWVEIHFPQHGWLAFEPTPRSDGLGAPSYSRLGTAGGSPTQTPSPSAASPTATATPSGAPIGGRDVEAPEGGKGGGGGTLIAPGAGIGFLVALAIFLPGSALLQRVLRRRHARGRRPMEVHYLEFLQWCRAASLPKAPGETPREHARRLGSRPKANPQPLDDLAALATAAVYSAGGPGDEPGDAARRSAEAVRAARAAVATSLPPVRRLLPLLGWGWWHGEEPRSAGRRRERTNR